jgi:hypothetical protein
MIVKPINVYLIRLCARPRVVFVATVKGDAIAFEEEFNRRSMRGFSPHGMACIADVDGTIDSLAEMASRSPHTTKGSGR